MARYVVFVAGAVMLWLVGPPSDQDENAYCVAASVCGVGALIELLDPTITVRLAGVVTDSLPIATCRPGGVVSTKG